ncbi:MAG TPA: ROK family protein [Chthonomonadaceae bacterium]|nr:ROK family protein [Chthonomonadaceae bacterium]
MNSPHHIITPSPHHPYAIGIDVGGTNIKAVAVSVDGELLLEWRQPTAESEAGWAGRVREAITRIEGRTGRAPGYVGLAAPGLAAPDGRSIAWMRGRMESLQGLDWTTFLASSRVVPVLNDAQAALLGETWRGAAAGSRNAVMLTLGTGVGGAAIVDGRLLRGHIGRAGHLGHISLDPDGPPDITNAPGSLEDAIGECTLAARTGGRFGSTADLVAAARTGDAEARRVWERSVKALAAGIASLINVLDPEVVILGGGIVNAGAALFEPLGEWIARFEWRPTGSAVRLVTASLGDMAGAWGAAANALHVPD